MSEVTKYSMTIKVTKPNKDGRRDVYGEFTTTGDNEKEIKENLNIAMRAMLEQIN